MCVQAENVLIEAESKIVATREWVRGAETEGGWVKCSYIVWISFAVLQCSRVTTVQNNSSYILQRTRREESEGSQQKEMVNALGEGHANCPFLNITHCIHVSNCQLYPTNMYKYYVSIKNNINSSKELGTMLSKYL